MKGLVVLNKTTRLWDPVSFGQNISLSHFSDSLALSLWFLRRRRNRSRAGNRLTAVTAAAGFKSLFFLHYLTRLSLLYPNLVLIFVDGNWFHVDLKGKQWSHRVWISQKRLCLGEIVPFLSLSYKLLKGFRFWKMMENLFRVLHVSVYLLMNDCWGFWFCLLRFWLCIFCISCWLAGKKLKWFWGFWQFNVGNDVLYIYEWWWLWWTKLVVCVIFWVFCFLYTSSETKVYC